MEMRWSVVAVAVILLAGCGAAPAAPVSPTVTPVAPPTVTAMPATVTSPEATSTVPPATAIVAAPAPTPRPPAAPAATGERWTADQVIAAFKSAGLEAEGVTKLTREDYGMAPLLGEGVRFLVPSLGADKGGRVFVVDAPADRDRLAEYYRAMGKASAILFSHVFTRGNVIVQINGDMKDEQAARYESALKAMK